jgi:CheY-like chemotaxis protein
VPASRAGRDEQPRRRRPRVLVVDDTADVRDLYAEYFDAVGIGAVTAQDGAAGFTAAVHHRPDVIVMDLSMPRVDGIAAIKHLKSDRRTSGMPVILLTGYPYKAIERGALEAGADVFLTKPCLPEDLEQHVRRLIEEPKLHPAA